MNYYTNLTETDARTRLEAMAHREAGRISQECLRAILNLPHAERPKLT